ncbi:hypothetical protein B0H34DRAFT_654947 [Crassisporium funariophilum]|nr:hypothetical protein B0H34DRAFT_654947 [Crassisporium funariophilum]
MLDSRLCSKSFLPPCLIFPRSFLCLVLFYLVQASAAQQLRNVSIPITSPQIVYTPFVCNTTAVLANPQACAGAWQTSNSSDTGLPVISSRGPSTGSANIIPQLFFEFRASTLYLTTLPSSNATANITISSNGVVVSSLFNSALGFVTIVDLPESQPVLLTITYIPGDTPTQFALESLVITVPADG